MVQTLEIRPACMQMELADMKRQYENEPTGVQKLETQERERSHCQALENEPFKREDIYQSLTTICLRLFAETVSDQRERK